MDILNTDMWQKIGYSTSLTAKNYSVPGHPQNGIKITKMVSHIWMGQELRGYKTSTNLHTWVDSI